MPRSSTSFEGPLLCACGRPFSQQGALNKHRNVCLTSKRHLSSALDQAKRLWTGTKRRYLHTDAPAASQPSAIPGLIPESTSESDEQVRSLIFEMQHSIFNLNCSTQTFANDPPTLDEDVDNSQLSMMERRPWTQRLNRRLPLRFRDPLPQPSPHLPPTSLIQTNPPPLAHSPLLATTSPDVRLGSLRVRDLGSISINDKALK